MTVVHFMCKELKDSHVVLLLLLSCYIFCVFDEKVAENITIFMLFLQGLSLQSLKIS